MSIQHQNSQSAFGSVRHHHNHAHFFNVPETVLLEEKHEEMFRMFRGIRNPKPSNLAPLVSPPTATSTAPLAMPTPLEEDQQNTQEDFDIIMELLGAGVPHIAEQILSYLDGRSLMRAKAVSTLWRDVFEELPIWKQLVKRNVKSNELWRDLFERRGWNKYLHLPMSQQISSPFYRHLYQSVFRDIHTLETNWSRGNYTLTKIWTGSEVLCLQFDENKIVTGHGMTMTGHGYGDNTIKIWDRSTLQLSKVLRGHSGMVWCLQYNEEVVISGSQDATVKVWDIQTGQIMNTLRHHSREVYSLKFTADTLVTGSQDGTVAVLDIQSPTDITPRTVLNTRDSLVFALDMSEINIFSGHGYPDHTIKVWESFTGRLVRTLRGHSQAVRSLQLRGSHLISGSWDGTIRIWNINSEECVRVLHGHENKVCGVTVDDKRIISGSEFGTVMVWDLAAALDSGSASDSLRVTTLEEHRSMVWAVSADAYQLITGSTDGYLLIHNFLQLNTVTSP